MGMDACWYATLVESYFESTAATELPIWRVFKADPSGRCVPMSEEGTWEEIWKQVMERRAHDPGHRYDCDTSIPYERG